MHLQRIKGLPANVHGEYLMILEFEVHIQIFSADPSLTLVSEAPLDLKVQHLHIIQRIRQYTVKNNQVYTVCNSSLKLWLVKWFIYIFNVYSAPNIMKVKLISGIYLKKNGLPWNFSVTLAQGLQTSWTQWTNRVKHPKKCSAVKDGSGNSFQAFSILNHVLQRSATPVVQVTQQHLCHRVLLCESFGLHHVASSMLTLPLLLLAPLAPPSGSPHASSKPQFSILWLGLPMRARSFCIEKVKLYKWSPFLWGTPYLIQWTLVLKHVLRTKFYAHGFKQLLLLFKLEPGTKNMGNRHLASVKPGSSLGGLFQNFGSDASNNQAQEVLEIHYAKPGQVHRNHPRDWITLLQTNYHISPPKGNLSRVDDDGDLFFPFGGDMWSFPT